MTILPAEKDVAPRQSLMITSFHVAAEGDDVHIAMSFMSMHMWGDVHRLVLGKKDWIVDEERTCRGSTLNLIVSRNRVLNVIDELHAMGINVLRRERIFAERDGKPQGCNSIGEAVNLALTPD